MYSLGSIGLLASAWWVTGVMSFPLSGTESLVPCNCNEMKKDAGHLKESCSTLQKSCCRSDSSVISEFLEKSAQSSYAEENDNRVWMLTAEGIQSNMIQYNRVFPGHKYIINNVGGRRLKFGPEDPPQQYVNLLGEYDCLKLLAPLRTVYPKAAPGRMWWTHQTKPHEKWIFNTPAVEEAAGVARGFCITVTDVESGKTAEVKIRDSTTATLLFTCTLSVATDTGHAILCRYAVMFVQKLHADFSRVPHSDQFDTCISLIRNYGGGDVQSIGGTSASVVATRSC